jgi:oligoribonuclease NrnB/cAMP/cGMP phosphodiesterase (DHH superfamily)
MTNIHHQESEPEFERIVTHNDFDGVASAAICAYLFDVETFIFTGPNSITRSEISVTERDIVCDLPYPLVAGLWFDHHVGNLGELELRGIDPNTIPGEFAEKPSCCRVIFDHYSQEENLPDDFRQLTENADIIDAFQYTSVDEWRRETPAKIIDWAIKAPGTNRDKHKFLRKLVAWLRDTSLEETSQESWVTERVTAYRRQEEWMMKLIPQAATFLPQDTQHEIVVLDMTQFSKRERILKNLALLEYPNALAFLEIQPQFQGGVRTTDLSFSMSLSLILNDVDHAKDVGEIMRQLNLGDGHPGAGAGLLHAPNKQEMLRKKQETLEKIFSLWSSQPLGRKP